MMQEYATPNQSTRPKRLSNSSHPPPKRISTEILQPIPSQLSTEEHLQFLQNQIVSLKDLVVALQLSQEKLLIRLEAFDARKDPDAAHQDCMTHLPYSYPNTHATTPICQTQDNHLAPTLPEITPQTSSENLQWTTVDKKKAPKSSKKRPATHGGPVVTPATPPACGGPMKLPKVDNSSHHPHQSHLPSNHSSAIPTTNPTSQPSQRPMTGPYTVLPPARPTYLAAASVNANRIKKDLQSASNLQKLEYLLKQPIPEEKRIDNIVSVVLTTTLSRKALSAPTTAWKTLIKTISNHSPLLISIINSTTAEVFMDSRLLKTLTDNLPPSVKIDNLESPSTYQVQRRAKIYLKGYYKTLRWSTFKGLSPHHQFQLLEYASQLISTTFTNPTLASRWNKTIKYDKRQLQLIQDVNEEIDVDL
jgi:hypothetical protein